MERAMIAQSHNKHLVSKSRSENEKAAWTDCLKLYEDTIIQLNKTLDPNTKSTGFDQQIWLSAALTNIETCRTGFIEMGVSDYMLPLLSNNVSQLISNTLSLHNVFSIRPETYKSGFPNWVKVGDRKLLQRAYITADLVVAQDGSGDHTTIQAALDVAAERSGSSEKFMIYIKRGLYEENLEIGNNLKNIMLVGDGLKHTIISGSRSFGCSGGGYSTFNTATVGFIARGITFRNTAGPKKCQAVALRSGSDRSIFYRCGFVGYQDTLYVHSQRQFYKNCHIYGTVDFIFGDAAVVLQNCMIFARRPMHGQSNAITAQSRANPNQTTGIIIQNSRVMAAPDLVPVLSKVKTFLGRPWKEYSRTVFMCTFLDTLVDPAGWLEWDGDFGLDTLYYGEYNNFGPGASTSGRVKWGGYRVINSSTEASMFTVENFISRDLWLPDTGVPFTAGLY
ncbi:hypothetical protein Pint_17241 [Pistacia integerrima]|uniref:Uncharacterized protein n=1 Tax=Pistacia integerrima TaxID=434235 RepID=A0ACC0YVG6_9ROSI|nr:hypothetical protein Pint_17241 [Pistacia integerrima]